MPYLTTLGRIDLSADDGSEVRALLAQPKRLALLVYLARLPDGAFCRRDTLLGVFWPELSQAAGRAALRKALHFIRRSAGEVVATRGADEVGVAPGALRSDAAELLAAAGEGRFADGLALYGGDFLPGFFLSDVNGFERWMEDERRRLRAAAAECARGAVAAALAAEGAASARPFAERGVAVDPGDEGALRRFMEVAARAGDRAAALAAYRAFAERAAAEYGLEPAPETRALADDLPAADPVPAQPLPQPPRPIADGPVPARAAAPLRPRWAVRVLADAAVAAGVLLARTGEGAGTAGAAGSLAVLPFAVSGPAELAYLEHGLPVLLATRLDGTGTLGGADAPALAASATAEGPGAWLYVTGSVAAAGGGRLRVSAALHDRGRGARAVAATTVEGAEADLHRIADHVATRLLAEYLDGTAPGMAATAARTTASPAALKHWLRGEDAFRRGRYEPAMAHFRDAVAADSGFALAAYRLAVAANWAGDIPAWAAATRRAESLEDRLTPHARMLLRAMTAFTRGKFHAAEPLYRAAAEARPDDAEAWFGLAEALFHGGPPAGRSAEASREAFERVLRLDPGNFAATVHLARLAAVRRDTAALDRLTAAALASAPDGPHGAELVLLRALGTGRAGARARATALRADPASLDGLWRAAAYTGALGDAAGVARTILRSTPEPEMRASLHLLVAHLEAGRGCPSGAEPHLEALRAHSAPAAALSRAFFAVPPLGGGRAPGLAATLAGPEPAPAGHLYVGVRIAPDFAASADALAARLAGDRGTGEAAVRRVEGNPHALAELGYALAATAADEAAARRALGAVAAADTLTGAPRPYFPRALLHLAAADLLERAGRPADALARLEGVPQDLGFDVALLAAVHRRRAELLDALGRSREAARERARAAAIRTGCPAPPATR